MYDNDAEGAALLKQLSVQYLKCFGIALFQKIKADLDGEKGPQIQLTYRAWDSVPRETFFSGELFVKIGEGPGSFGSWKKLFLVEKGDYNIEVYANSKDAEDEKKKPKKTVKIAGYTLIERLPEHFKKVLRAVGEGVGLTEKESEAMTSFSEFSWALAHQTRDNYIFQLHEQKGGGCCGGGGAVGPEDAGSENAEKREEWLEFMRRCIGKSHPRDLSTVSGRAFQMTMVRMAEVNANLRGWEDDGTEADILTSMLVEALLPSVQQTIINTLKGPISIKLALWYKTRCLIHTALSAMVLPAIAAVQAAAKAAGELLEPYIRDNVEAIVQKKEEIMEKMRAKISGDMGEGVKTVMDAMEDFLSNINILLQNGFDEGKNVLSNQIKIEELPEDAGARAKVLDRIPRNKDYTSGVTKAVKEFGKALEKLQSHESGFYVTLKPPKLGVVFQEKVLTTVDAAVFTLQKKMDDKDAKDAELPTILQEYDNDSKIHVEDLRKLIMKTIILAAYFGGAVEGAAGIKTAVDEFEDEIPEKMQKILNVTAILGELVERTIEKKIDELMSTSPPVASITNEKPETRPHELYFV